MHKRKKQMQKVLRKGIHELNKLIAKDMIFSRNAYLLSLKHLDISEEKRKAIYAEHKAKQREKVAFFKRLVNSLHSGCKYIDPNFKSDIYTKYIEKYNE